MNKAVELGVLLLIVTFSDPPSAFLLPVPMILCPASLEVFQRE
jgi:hypothetical protein